MLRMLCSSEAIDIASIVVSGFLSLVLIIVTIISAVSNCKVQKKIAKANQDSAEIGKETACMNKEVAIIPFKLKIIDSVSMYEDKFYNACTKLFLRDENIINDSDIKNSLEQLDLLTTQIYTDIIKIRAVCVQENNFFIVINKILCEVKKLYIYMGRYKSVLVNDLNHAKQKLRDEPQLKICEDLVKDVFQKEDNYKIYMCDLDRRTKEFIDQYILVYLELDEINYKDLIGL